MPYDPKQAIADWERAQTRKDLEHAQWALSTSIHESNKEYWEAKIAELTAKLLEL
jgi:hypothetical protein